ncbi:hypothetical protein ABW20_dc0104694 [Dactylellina cionopaga]|nr:hypothetical protein ABW20_dc0104694 [Dactylellina cionopaga]
MDAPTAIPIVAPLLSPPLAFVLSAAGLSDDDPEAAVLEPVLDPVVELDTKVDSGATVSVLDVSAGVVAAATDSIGFVGLPFAEAQ